jgi:hypothetical protein
MILFQIRSGNMSKSFLMIYVILGLFLMSFCYLQKSAYITLKDEKLTFSPHEFFIANITDERSDRSPVASLITIHSSAQNVDLQGGAANAIKLFIDHNLNHDTRLHPVAIAIKELKLTEKNSANGTITGDLSILFSFGLQRQDTIIHLLDYNGGIHYERDASMTDVAEPAIRHSIENAVSYFNKWINKQADGNILLAKSVKVTFTDYAEKPEGDTIYYSAKRPLTWDDFKDKPRDSRFDAEVFPAIGYAERVDVEKGIINVSLVMKVDAAKSDCWVKPGSHSDYALNHEQRHFDLEKIVSEHFKQKILDMKLPPDNFDGPINVEYLETLREATRLQKQYDAETAHGTNYAAQARWNEKIDKELKAYGIKK